MQVLICPDKFKGTLTSDQAARAIAAGWRKVRKSDRLSTLPISDGGDGFGSILAATLGAKRRTTRTTNAAGEAITAEWYFAADNGTAIIETARVNGLAMLPPGKFHPFELDTHGLGRVVQAAADHGARRALLGIGGSATNDAGFGMARALGWKFLDRTENEISRWTELTRLQRIVAPRKRKLIPHVIVAVDVQNPLLGARGCSRIYGPQKGLRDEDMKPANAALRKLATVLESQLGLGDRNAPGAGAAGGLGFGLVAFLGATMRSGFEIVAEQTGLLKALAKADLVLTGEGAIDRSTLMGKGAGEIAVRCRQRSVPCLGLAGHIADRKAALKLFEDAGALTDLVSSEEAMRNPKHHLTELAQALARRWSERATARA